MAKQTFTTGQVLTAAQMTSLQQTAMLGGSTTAKTANYVLVAADAGTVVAMNAAGTTTITVNSGLFAAGDIVTIMNLGAGTTTITAGTATINTAGSLAVPQYDGGILYFTSASAAIYYDFTQVGIASPLTTKGDIWTYSTTNDRIGVGANNTVLTADSTTATGLKWAAPASSAPSWSLLNSGGTTLSGSSTTVSGISGVNQILIILEGASMAALSHLSLRLNADTGTNYANFGIKFSQTASTSTGLDEEQGFSSNRWQIGYPSVATRSVSGGILIQGCNGSGLKVCYITTGTLWGTSDTAISKTMYGLYSGTSTISSIEIGSQSSTFDAGKVYVYTSVV